MKYEAVWEGLDPKGLSTTTILGIAWKRNAPEAVDAQTAELLSKIPGFRVLGIPTNLLDRLKTKSPVKG